MTSKLAFNASPATVWRMLTAVEYSDFKRAQSSDFGYEIEALDQGTRITITRPITTELPGPAAALLGTNPQVVEIQTWSLPQPDESRDALLEINILGAPATIAGHAHLDYSAGVTCVDINISISVAIPLFGSTAEQLIKTELEKYIQLEQELGNRWLASHES